MPIALDPKETYDYVLEAERKLGDEEQTVFQLRGLTIAEEAALNNTLVASDMGGDEMKWKTGDYQLKTLKLGLVGWRNFNDAEGVDVPFEAVERLRLSKQKRSQREDTGVTLACLDRLSSVDRTELANAIGNGAKVSETEGN